MGGDLMGSGVTTNDVLVHDRLSIPCSAGTGNTVPIRTWRVREEPAPVKVPDADVHGGGSLPAQGLLLCAQPPGAEDSHLHLEHGGRGEQPGHNQMIINISLNIVIFT